MAEKRIESQSIAIINGVERAGATGGIELNTDIPTGKALDMEVFMRQDVEVCFSEPPTENDPLYVEINVNGDYRCCVRDGNPVMLKRYHLAVLAQAKSSRVRQQKKTDHEGFAYYKDENVLSQTYPFTVLADPAGRVGSDWLRIQMRNPG